MTPVIGLSHITNPLATPYQLQNTASQLDRIPGDLEVSIKFEGSRLIQAAGVLLHLPQELIAEAIIIYARFWLGPEGGSLAEYHAKVCMFKGAGIGCIHNNRKWTSFGEKAFAHLNSALFSPQLLYLTHQPPSLATAAIYLAAKEIGVKLPGEEWWEVFDVDREELGFLVVALISMERFIAEETQKWSKTKVPLTLEDVQAWIDKEAQS
ncbi:unnamed protein product [Aureobasidium pullulans]|nr:unnamed protein product [Aureobasidium pullulans]